MFAIDRSFERRGVLFCPPSFPLFFMYFLNVSFFKTIISNFDNHKQKISFQERLIKNSSIEKNLNKGYSLILNNKKLIKNKNELKKVNKFTVRFKDGDLEIDKV